MSTFYLLNESQATADIDSFENKAMKIKPGEKYPLGKDLSFTKQRFYKKLIVLGIRLVEEADEEQPKTPDETPVETDGEGGDTSKNLDEVPGSTEPPANPDGTDDVQVLTKEEIIKKYPNIENANFQTLVDIVEAEGIKVDKPLDKNNYTKAELKAIIYGE